MSIKKLKRAAARAKREEEQGKRVMWSLIGALLLIAVMSVVAIALF